jgi:hypothetical protein
MRFVVIFVIIVWKTIWESIIWEEQFRRDNLGGTIWGEQFGGDNLEGTIWGERAKEKYLIRENGTEFWGGWDIKRGQIEEFYWLNFLASVSSVSKFCFVSSYQIFLPRSLPSNCFPQIVLYKLFFSNDALSNCLSNDYYKDYYKSHSYTVYIYTYIDLYVCIYICLMLII